MVQQHLVEGAHENHWHAELPARLPKIAADLRDGVGDSHQMTDPDEKDRHA
jgi:hypothetical protein